MKDARSEHISILHIGATRMKATGVDTLPEEVLQCLFQHVKFTQRQGTHAPPRPVSDLFKRLIVCRVKVAPLVCKKWARALRQSSHAWDDLRFDCRNVGVSTAVFQRLSWVEQRCSSTTTAVFVTNVRTAEQLVSAILTKLAALKRLVYYQLSTDGTLSRTPLHIGPFASLLPCPHLTYLYISMREVWQGHLDLLAHLKHLLTLVVKGHFLGGTTPEHGFPGKLATVQTLRTLHITGMYNGISTIGDAISKLSRLEDLHLVNCQVSHVSSALLQLHQLRALQICNTALDPPLVLPELSLLPKLANLAVHCDNQELPDVLLNCTQLTSFCFQSGFSVFDLPTGSFLSNLEEIAVESYRAKPSLFKHLTKLQRLFLSGSSSEGHVLSQTEVDVRTFAMSVPTSLQKMYASWPGTQDSRVAQNCILLNQLLTEKCSRSGSTLLQVSSVDGLHTALPWTTRPQFRLSDFKDKK